MRDVTERGVLASRSEFHSAQTVYPGLEEGARAGAGSRYVVGSDRNQRPVRFLTRLLGRLLALCARLLAGSLGVEFKGGVEPVLEIFVCIDGVLINRDPAFTH